LRHCARVICPSQATKRDLLRRYPEYQFKTQTFSEAAYEVIPIDECSAEVSALKRSFGGFLLFIFVAVDWPHKNHKLLIKAAKQLQSMTDRPFKVVFIGHRRSNMLQRLIQEYNVQNLVVDVGNISRKLLVAYYHTATAFLFPSLCEGFGIPLVEAMHCSLPIIASNQSCIPEICGEVACLLPPGSPEPWAREMLRMMENRSYRQKYSRLSSERAAHFTWEQTWRELDSIFAEILDGGGS
jgi:glycosyltransferase involved in cell wall biosynthesis